MLTNMINAINNAFQPISAQNPQSVGFMAKPAVNNENPFATPFITVQNKRQALYGKNNPVAGGYFAGYYNGSQNIVGRKIFVDV